MKKLFTKWNGMLAALALMLTALNVNSTCWYFAHQPELPAGAEKLRKIS